MEFSRRQLIATTGGALMLSVAPCTAQAAQMVDVRMWPAKAYTRVTLEHDQPIKFRYFIVRSPKPIRLVVDIEADLFSNEGTGFALNGESFKTDILNISDKDLEKLHMQVIDFLRFVKE